VPVGLKVDTNVVSLCGVMQVLDSRWNASDWDATLDPDASARIRRHARTFIVTLTLLRYFVELPFAYAVWTTPTWSWCSPSFALVTRSPRNIATITPILSPSSMRNVLPSAR
jgi:hypothetical protein